VQLFDGRLGVRAEVKCRARQPSLPDWMDLFAFQAARGESGGGKDAFNSLVPIWTVSERFKYVVDLPRDVGRAGLGVCCPWSRSPSRRLP